MLGPLRSRRRLELEGEVFDVEGQANEGRDECRIRVEKNEHRVRVLDHGPSLQTTLIDGRVVRFTLHGRSNDLIVCRRGNTRKVRLDVPAAGSKSPGAASARTGELKAPMPGRVLAVQVGLGQSVERGAPLVLIEAMKMQNQLFAGSAGVVSKVCVEPGMVVERGALLIRID